MTAYSTESRMPEQVMSHDSVEDLLDRAPVGRLGMSVDDQPLVVPLNYVYTDGKVYFHSASEGQKVDFLRKNPKVCFEVDEAMGVRKSGKSACSYLQTYKSVIAYGKARFIEDEDELNKMLQVMIEKYAGKVVDPSDFGYCEDVAVVEVELDYVSGKEHL